MQTNTYKSFYKIQANETCPDSGQVSHNMNNRGQIITAGYVRFDFVLEIPNKVRKQMSIASSLHNEYYICPNFANNDYYWNIFAFKKNVVINNQRK